MHEHLSLRALKVSSAQVFERTSAEPRALERLSTPTLERLSMSARTSSLFSANGYGQKEITVKEAVPLLELSKLTLLTGPVSVRDSKAFLLAQGGVICEVHAPRQLVAAGALNPWALLVVSLTIALYRRDHRSTRASEESEWEKRERDRYCVGEPHHVDGKQTHESA